MNNLEILEKAVSKAIENGWHSEKPLTDEMTVTYVEGFPISVDWWNEKNRGVCQIMFRLFDHDFAKALWGNKVGEYLNKRLGYIVEPQWQYHLQQMVIAEDPIKYLGENI